MKMSTLDLAAMKPSTLNQAEVHVWSCRLDAAPDAAREEGLI